VLRHAADAGLENRLDVRAGFCFEKCETGPTVMINGECMHHCTADRAIQEINNRIEGEGPEHKADAESGHNGTE